MAINECDICLFGQGASCSEAAETSAKYDYARSGRSLHVRSLRSDLWNRRIKTGSTSLLVHLDM